MKKQKFQKAKLALLTTTAVLAISTGSAMILDAKQDKEIELLQSKINRAYSQSMERENVIIELQKAITKKSESLIDLKEDHKVLQTNYNNTKAEYEKNLKRLNSAENKLKSLRTEKISEVKKINTSYTSWKKMVVNSTAYTKFENGDELGGRRWGNLTKSGEPVRYGVVAVDTSVIPLGTEIYIPSLNKVFVALDTGGAIKGKIIDVYFDSLQDCISWGRKQNLEIYVNM